METGEQSEQVEQTLQKEAEKAPHYDVVVVLGGNIRPTIRLTKKVYVTTSHVEGSEKSIGAHARTLAAAELYKRGRASYFIVSTGKTSPDPEAPTEAAVMKEEMVRCGVPQGLIIPEDISVNTLENAAECAEIIRQNDFKNIGILTSSWHLSRAMVMFKAQGLEEEGKKLYRISAEKILAEKSPKYKRIIRKVYSTESMRQRVKGEKKGIGDFRAGRYKPQPPR
jgi:uncharacterized SAM-binding protein YcdF (DUF218 family)